MKFNDAEHIDRFYKKINMLLREEQRASPKESSQIIYDLAKMTPYKELADKSDELKDLVRNSVSLLSNKLSPASLDSSDLANNIWALSKLNYYNQAYLDRTKEKLINSIHTLNPHDLVKVLNGVAKLGYFDEQLVSPLVDSITKDKLERGGRNQIDQRRAKINSMFYLGMIYTNHQQALNINTDLKNKIENQMLNIYKNVEKNFSKVSQDEEMRQILVVRNILNKAIPDTTLASQDLMESALRKNNSTIVSDIHQTVLKYIQKQIGSVNIEEWNQVTASSADITIKSFYEHSKSKVVEIDGPSHYRLDDPRARNATTIFHTILLKEADMDILRIDYRDIAGNKYQEKLKNFLGEKYNNESATSLAKEEIIPSSSASASATQSDTTATSKKKQKGADNKSDVDTVDRTK